MGSKVEPGRGRGREEKGREEEGGKGKIREGGEGGGSF